jgi:hypothetical protein
MSSFPWLRFSAAAIGCKYVVFHLNNLMVLVLMFSPSYFTLNVVLLPIAPHPTLSDLTTWNTLNLVLTVLGITVMGIGYGIMKGSKLRLFRLSVDDLISS